MLSTTQQRQKDALAYYKLAYERELVKRTELETKLETLAKILAPYIARELP